MYYIVDLEKSKNVGSIVYWNRNGNGYTYDVGQAALCSEKESYYICDSDITGNTIRILDSELNVSELREMI